jgi:hypothetical protein
MHLPAVLQCRYGRVRERLPGIHLRFAEGNHGGSRRDSFTMVPKGQRTRLSKTSLKNVMYIKMGRPAGYPRADTCEGRLLGRLLPERT